MIRFRSGGRARRNHCVGPAPLGEIVAQVRRCRGPSGPNVEYVLRLAEALRAMGVATSEDAHVFELAAEISGS